MVDLNIAMKRMGYTPIWIKAGFIDADEIISQFQRLQVGIDSFPEHYRIRTLRSLLDNAKQVSSDELNAYIEIATNEVFLNLPGKMKESVFHELIKNSIFTDSQFQSIADSFDSPTFNHICERESQLRQLKKEKIPTETIENFIAIGHKDVQRKLVLSYPNLTRSQCRHLAEFGKTRAIRNLAKQKLKNDNGKKWPKTRIMYIEKKSNSNDRGPARIGHVRFSKSGSTLYYKTHAFQKLKGSGVEGGNYFDVDTREEYWISGPKKNMQDRHWAGGGPVEIDKDAKMEYEELMA